MREQMQQGVTALSHPLFSGGSGGEAGYCEARANLRASSKLAWGLTAQGHTVVQLCAVSDGLEDVPSVARRGWLVRCLSVVRVSARLVVPQGWERSAGCRREVRYARLLGIPVLLAAGSAPYDPSLVEIFPARRRRSEPLRFTSVDVEERGLLLGIRVKFHEHAYVTRGGLVDVSATRLTPEQLRTLADIAEAVSLFGAEEVRGELLP